MRNSITCIASRAFMSITNRTRYAIETAYWATCGNPAASSASKSSADCSITIPQSDPPPASTTASGRENP